MEFVTIFVFFFIYSNPLVAVELGIARWSCNRVLVIAACLYAAVYAFKAAALFVMAKRSDKKKLAWCAFVPFASTYLMGELAGKTRLFNLNIKKIGLIVMIAELVTFLAFLCEYIPEFYIFESGFYYAPVKGDNGLNVLIRELDGEGVPYWMFRTYDIGSTVYAILSWVYLAVSIVLYISLYRTYYARGHVVFTCLSAIIPISSPFILFAIRNNAPIDYQQYIQDHMERMRRAQQNYPYGNPYGGTPYGGNSSGDPYGGSYGGSSSAPDDPFGEYTSGSDKKDDPNDPFN